MARQTIAPLQNCTQQKGGSLLARTFCCILGMSLDFVLTHFYRLVVHDFVLLSDVYWFYSKGRPEGKTVEEFAEVSHKRVCRSLGRLIHISLYLDPFRRAGD